MISKIQRWGNSLALRIPAAFAKETGMDQGTEVDLRLEEGRLVISPRPEGRYSLDEMLESVTPDNLHGEIDTGAPLGREIW